MDSNSELPFTEIPFILRASNSDEILVVVGLDRVAFKLYIDTPFTHRASNPAGILVVVGLDWFIWASNSKLL